MCCGSEWFSWPQEGEDVSGSDGAAPRWQMAQWYQHGGGGGGKRRDKGRERRRREKEKKINRKGSEGGSEDYRRREFIDKEHRMKRGERVGKITGRLGRRTGKSSMNGIGGWERGRERGWGG